MHPFLHIFALELPSFGAMLLVGALAAASILCWRARVKDIARGDLLNMMLFALIGAMAGGFLLNALLMLPQVLDNWQALTLGKNFLDAAASVMAALTGLVFYGGFLGGAVGVLVYARLYRLPFWPVADAAVPAIPLAHAIGRIGCLLGGCCYGMELSAGHPLAIVYPQASLAAPPGVALLAAPLIEAGYNLLLFALLLMAERTRPFKTHGRLFSLYLAAYACARFTLEFFRGDAVRGFLGPLSTSQVVALFMLIAAAALWFTLPRRHLSGQAALEAYRAQAQRQAELAARHKAAKEAKP